MTLRMMTTLLATLGLAGAAIAGCSTSTTTTSAEATAQGDQDLYGLGSIATRWPNGVVPVCFKDTTSHPDLQAKMPGLLARSWSTAANITFTGFGACAASGNQVTVVFATTSDFRGNTAGLGAGASTVTLISDDTSANQAHFQYEVIHEMGHALGFVHEMKRPDNWSDAGVAYQCGETPAESDYSQYESESGGLYLTATYDSASIMNYCDPDGNQTTSLSAGDVSGVSKTEAYGTPALYATPKAVTVKDGSSVATQIVAVGSWATNASEPVSYSIYGALPAGITAAFSSSPPNEWLTISAALGTPVEQEILTIVGKAGSVTHATAVTVSVAPCVPETEAVACDGAACGSEPNGCGGTVSCGTCPGTESCYANECYACAARICPVAEHWDPTKCACEGCPCGTIHLSSGQYICAVCRPGGLTEASGEGDVGAVEAP